MVAALESLRCSRQCDIIIRNADLFVSVVCLQCLYLNAAIWTGQCLNGPSPFLLPPTSFCLLFCANFVSDFNFCPVLLYVLSHFEFPTKLSSHSIAFSLCEVLREQELSACLWSSWFCCHSDQFGFAVYWKSNWLCPFSLYTRFVISTVLWILSSISVSWVWMCCVLSYRLNTPHISSYTLHIIMAALCCCCYATTYYPFATYLCVPFVFAGFSPQYLFEWLIFQWNPCSMLPWDVISYRMNMPVCLWVHCVPGYECKSCSPLPSAIKKRSGTYYAIDVYFVS